MTHESNSQRGGESAFRGLDYQKKFIAYLSSEMLRGTQPIKGITCEHLDDIEVEQNDSTLRYYQIKSTTSHTLSKSQIIESVKLFLSIQARKGTDASQEYILLSNAHIRKITKDLLVLYPFKNLDYEIKKEIGSLKEVQSTNHLEKIFFMRGPSVEEISSVITANIVRALKDNYDFIAITNDLLHHINRMCAGPVDLEDVTMINEGERDQYVLKHKTINMSIIIGIIENKKKILSEHVIASHLPATTSPYDSPIRDPTKGETKKIWDLVEEYSCFAEGDELQFTYLQNFNKVSIEFKMYKNTKFLDFLNNQIKTTNNKHIILECLIILHNLLLSSKKEGRYSFVEYIKKEYFPLLKQHLESGNETFEYSYSKIEQIFEELKIANEEMCEMYWKRMVTMIHKISKTGITDNRWWLCINALNKCKIKTVWRKWLITKDKYYDIKKAVMKELADSSLI